jgi:hypothetical protein
LDFRGRKQEVAGGDGIMEKGEMGRVMYYACER